MKLRKITAFAAVPVAALGIVFSASAASAAPSGARLVPVVYSGTGTWNGVHVRPGKMIFVGYGPWGVRRVSWSRWSQAGAAGHGQAFGYFVSEHYVTRYAATVTFSDVKVHHGTRYFTHMRIAGTGHKTIRLHMSNGSWT
jgi:hypothetical protein